MRTVPRLRAPLLLPSGFKAAHPAPVPGSGCRGAPGSHRPRGRALASSFVSAGRYGALPPNPVGAARLRPSGGDTQDTGGPHGAEPRESGGAVGRARTRELGGEAMSCARLAAGVQASLVKLPLTPAEFTSANQARVKPVKPGKISHVAPRRAPPPDPPRRPLPLPHAQECAP